MGREKDQVGRPPYDPVAPHGSAWHRLPQRQKQPSPPFPSLGLQSGVLKAGSDIAKRQT